MPRSGGTFRCRARARLPMIFRFSRADIMQVSTRAFAYGLDHRGLMVRDARLLPRPHHEGLRFRRVESLILRRPPQAVVSKDDRRETVRDLFRPYLIALR
ncbi:hypothetical protein BRAS3843_1080020 [Bradyrhizobium sp. STM 3843]|nr:hypothetical protein BRAS3843_1080020 [Bradyrhizobium sp. STM 3843]